MNYSSKDIYSRIALTSNSDITYPSFLTVVLKSTRPSFFDKAGCTRQFESELSLHSLAPLFPINQGIFDSPVRSPLAKRGSLTHSQALSLYKMARDVTAPPIALNRFAIRLAGHQSPRQVVVRDGTAGRRLVKTMVVRDGTALLEGFLFGLCN